MRIFLILLVNTLAVIISAYILPGVRVSGFWTALLVAIVLAVVNTFVRPILIFLTLPINILTLGLFTFVINAAIILLAAAIVEGFKVDGFWWAILFSIILALVSSVMYLLLPGI